MLAPTNVPLLGSACSDEELAGVKIVAEVSENRSLRQVGLRSLEAKGFEVANAATGSGTPPYSRLRASRGNERYVVVVKAVTKPAGRIHFTPENGRWKALEGATHVLHVWDRPADPGRVRLRLFEVGTVLAAFEKNHAAKVEHGQGNLPCWVSPEFEEGWRHTGSGFGRDALWDEITPLDRDNPQSSMLTPPPSGPGFLEQVRAMVAAHMGVAPERIEVEVRVKL